MRIKTKDFQEVSTTIRQAIEDSITNLELIAKNAELFLNVTNKEYYVSVKFPLSEPIDFAATVDAALFLDLVSGLTSEDVGLDID
ncbi:MAG: hypothetical protein J6Z11_11605, partial [Candidatus Riflebacteria bacterium]|nr:hypothetical protein [Candidatus Riflebacteria bacterium]